MSLQNKKRILSGIQPTGRLHLGNYVGAIQQWVAHQGYNENFYCIVDLHTLTIPENMTAALRREKVRETLGIYLACGLDPKKSAIFVQSHVREHSELAWILNCVTPIGWLERMTQYKSKSKSSKSIGSGLLTYPVLMAADILLYDTDLVPVGDDQKQHVELACDIAGRFNHMFGDTFKIPKVVIKKTGARIMGFDDPTNKMSKSLGELSNTHLVGLLDSEKQIKKTIMSAQTDSGSEINFDKLSAGLQNLVTIYEALSGESLEQIKNKFTGIQYGYLKKAVFEIVLEKLKPIQAEYAKISSDQNYLDQTAKEGAQKALAVAGPIMQRVKKAVGV